MKLFLATLSLLLATANVSSALTEIAPVCSDDDGTIYEYAKEMQPGLFSASLRGNAISGRNGQSVLLLGCKSGTRVHILNTGWIQDILDQLQGFVDSPKVYTYQDIADIFNEDGIEAWVEEFDKNSCICGDEIEVSE
jgi:hypothetical protein